MKAAKIAAFSPIFAALLLSGCTPGRDWRSLKTPELRRFTATEPSRIVLKNGMVIFLQENRELPLINGRAYLRGGSYGEPEGKAGLIDVYGQVWRTGGTEKQTGDQLDDYLESRAAKVESSGDGDSTSLSFAVLKGDFDDVFAVFRDLLRKPAFREDKIALAKAQMAAGITRRNDDAGEIASRESQKLAYGPRSSIARHPELATVAAIQRTDLQAWHAAHVHPNQMMLGLVGDFDAKEMEQKLRSAFDDWPAGAPVKAPDLAIAEPKGGVFFVAKNDVNQSTIKMVHLGTTKRDKDFHAITVVNEVFGGGFASRLFSALRTKKGLAYRVRGGVGTDYDIPGVTELTIGTKSRTTAAAIEGLLLELDRLQKEPPTAEEIQRAKDAILNSFVFRYDSRSKVLSARMLYDFHGYPAEFLEQFRAGIEKVTPADAAAAARKHFDKSRLRILVVGKAADFDKPLSTFGNVTTLDITIPTPGGATPAGARE